MELKDIGEKLKGDLNRYKPMPFWSWNAKLEPEVLKEQIAEMKRNGIGGYFMHARGGLKTEYLSEDWMKCVEACADYGTEINMDSWIYDENGWPSGFAGGKLLDKEENRDCYVTYTIGKYEPGATVHYLTEGEQLRRVSLQEPDKEYLNVSISRAASTADILNPAVTEQFIALTHEAYKQWFGENFSKKIRGFFTDEPQYYRARTPYTDMLVPYFKEHYGEEVLDGIGLLFVEKKGYRKFRYRYWKAMQDLMLHNFSEKVYQWCEENKVELTGHYVEEVSLGNQMMCCGGVMPFYEYEHIPGIDWLGVATDNELSQRQVGSAARQLGKRQVLTETFGCCGWQITPGELKQIAEFQFVNGANLVCHHLFPYAEYGQRKRDYPAHFSSFNPWIEKEFAEFNRYLTRIGYLLAESEELVNVAVLHPIRSTYFDYKREKENFNLQEYEEQFRKDIRQFSAAGINYHFLDETLLAKHGFVKERKIGCGQCCYSYLVLPHILTMDCSTGELLRAYVENGGKVLILGEKPQFMEADRYDYGYLVSNCTFEEIREAQPCHASDCSTELYSSYRRMEDRDFLYVVNASKTKTYTQKYDIPLCEGKDRSMPDCAGSKINAFKRLDLNRLEYRTVPLTVTLEPGESAVLFPTLDMPEPVEEHTEYEFQLNRAEVSFIENSLIIDCVRYSTDGVQFFRPYPCLALFQKLLKERYEGTIWFQYEFEVRDIPGNTILKAEACEDAEHWVNGREIAFAKNSGTERNLLLADISSLVKTGRNVYTVKRNWHESELVYYALFGENVTENLKNCIVYDSELEAVYICGHFGVYTDEGFTDDAEEPCKYTYGNHFYIGKVPEHVTEPVYDGFPFFAGTLTIRQKVTFADENVMVRFGGTQTVAYVRVNGRDAGKLLFDRLLDISPYAVQGENELEIDFIISNRNLLGPHHFKGSLVRTIVTPGTFELYEFGDWEEDRHPFYEERYELLKLGYGRR